MLFNYLLRLYSTTYGGHTVRFVGEILKKIRNCSITSDAVNEFKARMVEDGYFHMPAGLIKVTDLYRHLSFVFVSMLNFGI
jgi:hypothetical protein